MDDRLTASSCLTGSCAIFSADGGQNGEKVGEILRVFPLFAASLPCKAGRNSLRGICSI